MDDVEQVDQVCIVGTDFFLPILYEFEVCGQDYPWDISGYFVEMQVGTGVFISGNTPLIDVTTITGQIIIDGPNGKINIWVPKTMTIDQPYGCVDYAVAVTNPVGLTEQLISGKWTFKGWGQR